MTTRIYVVEGPGGPRLVRAGNPAQAIRHVARKQYSAIVADQEALVSMLTNGVKIEAARHDDAE